eukprot:747091-Hanusia_phi.AAC.9
MASVIQHKMLLSFLFLLCASAHAIASFAQKNPEQRHANSKQLVSSPPQFVSSPPARRTVQ